MRKIKYPDAARMSVLLKEYQQLFDADILNMQNEWVSCRDNLRFLSTDPNKNTLYPDNIQDIFVKTYLELVDMYIDYLLIVGDKKDKTLQNLDDSLKQLFHYSGVDGAKVKAYQPTIADFFMKHSKELEISVCYYCETSFINTYGFSSIYKDLTKFLVCADKALLRRHIKAADGQSLSEKTIDKIFKTCNNSDESTVVDRFDNIGCFKKMNPKKSEVVSSTLRNHFDLDHFLPKSLCPLVALSFYNFVPSCAVCNEKLKGADKIGGLDRDRLLALSPTSNDYKFSDEITISIAYDKGISTLRMQEHPENFHLEFTPKDNFYQEIVSEFRLDERYNYHKQIALRQHDLYQDFSDGHISQLSNILGGIKSKKEIENQIFRGEYGEDTDRCFDKLKNDIKKQCGR